MGLSVFNGQVDLAAEAVQSVVVDGIVFNRSLTNQAVANVNNLISEIGSLLEGIANVPTVSVDFGLVTAVVDPFTPLTLPIKPIITASYPTLNALLDVTPNFPIQTEYVTALLTKLQDKLYDLIDNPRQTGLNPVIEQQIWDRGRERTNAASQGLVTQITRMFARSGWTMPTGDQAERIFQAQESAVEQDVTESRTIAVAQADLEQKNFQFSITQANALEAILTQLFTALQQRLVDSEKARLESLNQINKISSEVYKTQVEAVSKEIESITTVYKTDADAYKASAEAEEARINAQVAVQKNQLDYVSKKADISIEILKSNVATFLSQKELIIGTLRTIAQVESQLVASLGSAINYSAGINSGHSSSVTASSSISDSTSVSTSDITTHSG